MPVELIEKPASQLADPHKLADLPILLLNLHENCNCRCLMCDIWKRPPGLGLDLASFKHHRDSIVTLGVQQVVLTGGEPLLHSNFEALCSFLKSCEVRVTL